MTADVILLTCLSGSLWQRSIGAYQLASHLRQHNYSVQVIDFTDYFSNTELLLTIEKFIGDNTRMLGVSSTFYQSVKPEKNIKDNKDYALGAIGLLPANIVNSVKSIKEKHPHIKTAVGGGHSSIFENTDLFDIIVYGYAEEVFLEYLNSKRIYPRINNSLMLNGDDYKFDIEHLQHSWAREDCVLPNETLPIEISRGCIFKCKFCGYPLNGKKKFDYLRDPGMIVDELQENYERYGTTNYLFADDTFNDSTYKLEQLHKKITALPFKINFTTYLRLDLLNAHREQLDLLAELGLKSAFFGIESLNEKTARFIGKGLSSEKVKDFLLELKNDIWQDNISMLCTFIVGLPYEDIASTDQSFEWVQTAGINSAWTPLYIHTTHRYKSNIAINYEKYGYNILDRDLGTWTTDTLTWEQANVAATRYNSVSMPNNYVTSWILFSLLSYRLHSVDQLMKIQNKDFPAELYKKQHSNLFLEYKSQLLNLN